MATMKNCHDGEYTQGLFFLVKTTMSCHCVCVCCVSCICSFALTPLSLLGLSSSLWAIESIRKHVYICVCVCIIWLISFSHVSSQLHLSNTRNSEQFTCLFILNYNQSSFTHLHLPNATHTHMHGYKWIAYYHVSFSPSLPHSLSSFLITLYACMHAAAAPCIKLFFPLSLSLSLCSNLYLHSFGTPLANLTTTQ